jgi:phage terminase large subunit-like protein
MTAVLDDAPAPHLHVPPAYRPYLDNTLYWVDVALDATPATRRKITREEPLLFALVYFKHKLHSAETGWKYSVNQMHLDMAEEARIWRYDHGPQECRVGWVGPRNSGKSTWQFVILPIWAMAHGWRKCCLMFSDSKDQAERHFRRIRRELMENELLRLDYPDLCDPDTTIPVDNKNEYVSMGGHAFAARGLLAKTLGFIEFDRRPDLLIIDDVEPTGTQYSPDAKNKRLMLLTDMVFAMNLNAVVVLVGTVTRYGSIMHEIAQAAASPHGKRAEWIDDENIVCKYYPAIVIDETTGREASLWPELWSYEWQVTQRHRRTFQLNFMNMPLSQGKGFWHVYDFKYNPNWLIDSEVLSIDPAMKSQEQNDPTGVAVVGFDAVKYNSVVQFAEGVQLDPDGMRNLIKWILLKRPKITTVVIETNQGGDYVTNSLKPVIPRHIEIVTKHETVSKMERIKELHDWYQLGWVSHAPGLHSLEEQQLAYPEVDHDDIVDAVAKACRHHLINRPVPRPR